MTVKQPAEVELQQEEQEEVHKHIGAPEGALLLYDKKTNPHPFPLEGGRSRRGMRVKLAKKTTIKNKKARFPKAYAFENNSVCALPSTADRRSSRLKSYNDCAPVTAIDSTNPLKHYQYYLKYPYCNNERYYNSYFLNTASVSHLGLNFQGLNVVVRQVL